jgi:rhodanese-related sulfurtransferase
VQVAPQRCYYLEMSSTTQIDVGELEMMLGSGERVQVIDVRSAAEYCAGHIPGAMNVPLEEVEARLGDLSHGAKVVLVCLSGERSEFCQRLIAGHREVAILTGGTDAWEIAGKPLVRSSRTRWSLERQVRLGAGLLILTGTLLGYAVNPGWLFLAAFVGAGLTFAGITNICGMASVLAKMPWNRPRTVETPADALGVEGT